MLATMVACSTLILVACDKISEEEFSQTMTEAKGRKILIIGSVNADHVLRVKEFPGAGQTVKGESYRIIPGGKGANQAVASARTGGNVSLMACVGDDEFGSEMIKLFQKDQINTSLLEAVQGVHSGVALIFVDKQGENRIGISAQANAALSPESIKLKQKEILAHDYLLMQLEIPEESVIQAAQLAFETGIRVVLNPAPAKPLPDKLLALVNIITPNQSEAEVLTGVSVESEDDAEKAAQILHKKGIETVIITMGGKGAFVSDGKQSRLITGFQVTVRDTTAAGDTFNGALLVALAEGAAIETAVRFANAAAAISVTCEGAQPSIPLREEVETFLSSNSLPVSAK